MSVRRINRQTGVIEERHEFVDAISDGEWKPLVNEHLGVSVFRVRSRSAFFCGQQRNRAHGRIFFLTKMFGRLWYQTTTPRSLASGFGQNGPIVFRSAIA